MSPAEWGLIAYGVVVTLLFLIAAYRVRDYEAKAPSGLFIKSGE